MKYGKWYRDMGLLGFIIIGNRIPYMVFSSDYNLKKECDNNMKLVKSEIENCIIADLLEAIKNDLEGKKNNRNPEKWVREMLLEGLL